MENERILEGALDVYRHADGKIAAVAAWEKGASSPSICVKVVDGSQKSFSLIFSDDAPWPVRESHMNASFSISDGMLRIHHPQLDDPDGAFKKLFCPDASGAFVVRYQSIARVYQKDIETLKRLDLQLSEAFIAAFNETTAAEGAFPAGVIGIESGEIDVPPSGPATITIELKSSASSEADAWKGDIPLLLLAKIVDSMVTIDGECLANIDGWSIVAIEPAGNTTSCDECGGEADSIVGCPDGAEICQACFNSGMH